MCSYWRCYKLHIVFSVIISFAIEGTTTDSMDAFVLLHAQTEEPKERYKRDKDKFFKESFKGLRVQPAIVPQPGSGKETGRTMFGVVAEQPLEQVCSSTPTPKTQLPQTQTHTHTHTRTHTHTYTHTHTHTLHMHTCRALSLCTAQAVSGTVASHCRRQRLAS